MTASQQPWPAPADGAARGREVACALIDDLPILGPLRDLPPAVHARLAMLARARTFATGATLLRAGEDAGYAYLILHGRVRLERARAVPREVGPGAVLGALPDPATDRQPHTARAVGAVEALAIGHVALGVTMLQFPEATAALVAALRAAGGVWEAAG